MLTAGKILKDKRIALGKTIDLVSADTKIQKKYLEQIEEDKYDTGNPEIFMTGFIKIYADYLGLNVSRVLALYRRTYKMYESSKESKPNHKKKSSLNSKFFKNKIPITPQALTLTLIVLIILGILAYLFVQFYNFQRPPKLQISSPSNNSTVTEETILINGSTEAETIIEINDEPIKVSQSLEFEKEITLSEGSNTVTIRARKINNESRETVKILTINYTKPKEEVKKKEEAKVPEKPKVNKIKVEIVGAEAWVEIIVDGDQEAAEILPEGFSQEYEIKSDFLLTTGRASNTKVTVNGSPVQLIASPSTGVATVTCKVNQEALTCE